MLAYNDKPGKMTIKDSSLFLFSFCVCVTVCVILKLQLLYYFYDHYYTAFV